MDWNVFWTAGGVVITLGSLIIGCFRSLSKELHSIDRRLTVVETILTVMGAPVDFRKNKGS
jgi:hypothetical protein